MLSKKFKADTDKMEKKVLDTLKKTISDFEKEEEKRNVEQE